MGYDLLVSQFCGHLPGKIFGMLESIVTEMLWSDWLKKYQFSDAIFYCIQNWEQNLSQIQMLELEWSTESSRKP
jgi:hypothetical protein